MRNVQLHREWVRWLWARDIPLAHIAFVLELDLDLVKTDLAALCRRPDGVAWPFTKPTLAPARGRKIRAQCAVKVRRLDELGYTADRIADLLCLKVEAVSSFIRRRRRLRPRRSDRRKPGTMIRPRTKAEERAAKNVYDRAWRRRQKAELAKPAPGWGYADRRAAAAAEADALARFITAAREGRLSTGELLELAAGVHFAPPKLPEPEPWVGSSSWHSVGSAAKLDPDKIAEARVLRRKVGAPVRWPSVTAVHASNHLLRLQGKTSSAPPALPPAGNPCAKSHANTRHLQCERSTFRCLERTADF